jgi:hypothetical protein
MEYKKLDTKCEGVTYKRKPCDRYAVEDEEERNRMCSSHIYEYKFSKDELQNILNGSEKYRACSKCHEWHEDTDHANCKKCIKIAIDHRKKKKGEKILCKGFMKDIDKSPCNKVPCKDNPFCKRSHQYMKDYTEYQMAHLTQCSGCKRWMWLDGAKTCTDCRDIGKKNRKKLQDKKHPCKHDKCPYDCDDDKDYCGNHIKDAKRDEIIDRGGVVCSNFDSRYCVNEVTDGKKTCLECRAVGKKHDNKKYAEKQEKAAESRKGITNSNIKEFVEVNVLKKDISDDDYENIMERVKELESRELVCVNCTKKFPIQNFWNDYYELMQACDGCRKKQRDTDKRIDRIREDKKQKNEAIDEEKTVWRQLNPNLQKQYDETYKQKRINEMGKSEYNRIEAEYTKLYRESHPEIMAKMYDAAKKNPQRKYYIYARSAEIRELEWKLTYDECCDFFTGECNYCGVKHIKNSYLLGIDRVDNKCGYIVENCVTCCTMCNMIKGSTDKHVLYSRIKHILSFMSIIFEQYHNLKVFYNSAATSYDQHLKRCEDKGFKCELTKSTFYELKECDCYICGKKSNSYHSNGIDRIDSKMGYIKNNCLPCCSSCNYMKKNYNFADFVYHIYKMYTYKNDTIVIFNKGTIKVSCRAWLKYNIKKLDYIY